MSFFFQTNTLLPAEVLHIIFHHVENTSCWKETRDTFYQCQLVCHNWSRAAQIELYKNVYLPPDRMTSFSSTLLETKPLGHLVKRIEFYPPTQSSPCPGDFIVSCPSSVNQDIDIILQHCPNLERITSSIANKFESNFIWRRLQKAASASVVENPYKRLQLFASSDVWSLEESHLYSTLCLQFRRSLVKLRLLPNHLLSSDSSQQRDANFQMIKSKLKEFQSLEELQLCGAFVKESLINDVDEILDNCHKTTQILQLLNCNLSCNYNHYTGKVIPNRSVKILSLISQHLPASSIRYFAKKLAGLQILALGTEVSILKKTTDVEAECTEWWYQMTKLCKRLQVYNINIDQLDYEAYLHQIKGCVNMSSTIANALKKKAAAVAEIPGFGNEFIMDLSDPEGTEEKYVIELKQNGSCARLFKSFKGSFFNELVDYGQLFGCIKPFSPDVIRIFNKPYEFWPNNVRNWDVFNGVMSLIKDRKASLVHFDTLTWIEPFSNTFQHDQSAAEGGKNNIKIQANISTLMFTGSVLHVNCLPEMSPKLANIDTLIFEGCAISSESPYKLDIILPETKIGRLELNTMAAFYQNQVSFLHGFQTIVVTTDTAKMTTCTYTQNVIHNIPCQKPAGTLGSAENFLITIRCKELKSLAVSGTEVLEMS
ncbi:hypothetical protein [Parasitella parasitica]|uniref:F-box domain-containing protein n=1 Tax=Parasitella parasitica TaxID=35722 RepID=A0A0B7MYI4_9FUNG|nr:hypothetical protein [Parasitella parasitica]